MLGITGPKRQILGAELAGIVEAAGPAAPITAAKNKTNPAVRQGPRNATIRFLVMD
jgi:hypothetical protein